MRKKIFLIPLLALLLTLVLVGAVIANARPQSEFAITWSVKGGGGGPKSGGDFTMNGTSGQTAVGSSSGGNIDLKHGFWQEFLPPPPSFTISGQVLEEGGSPLAGVVISTGEGLTSTTDLTGNYSFAGLITGTYTLTPDFPGYAFTPLSRTVSLPPDAEGQDFTASLLTYSISGQVVDGEGNPLEGVTITADGTYTATTDSLGNYLIAGLLPGTYTVTATLDGYTFAPEWREVSLPPDAVGQDFVAEAEVVFVMLPLVVK